MAEDYRTAGRSRDDWIALETIDSLRKTDPEEAQDIAQMAMDVSKVEGVDPIDGLTLIMKLGQYFATHAGVKK